MVANLLGSPLITRKQGDKDIPEHVPETPEFSGSRFIHEEGINKETVQLKQPALSNHKKLLANRELEMYTRRLPV